MDIFVFKRCSRAAMKILGNFCTRVSPRCFVAELPDNTEKELTKMLQKASINFNLVKHNKDGPLPKIDVF